MNRRPAARRGGTTLANPARRLAGGLLGLGVLLSVLGARLVQLQGLDAAGYAVAALDQRRHTFELPAVRGEILDRNGYPLAMNVDSRLVYADPKLVADPTTAAVQLSPYLHQPVAGLLALLLGIGRPAGTRYVELARGLPPATGKSISALNLPGIEVIPQSTRTYPTGSLAAAVVGFTNYEGQGAGGLELALDRLLTGRNGRLTEELGRDGRVIPAGRRVEVAPVPGADVELTIDQDLQYKAEQAITAQVRATGARNGTVIVLDPRTGEVLAMATAPTFDSNAPGRAPAADRGNRAVSDVYEPGSVNKVITAAAALAAGIVTPDSVITVPPQLQVFDRVFHDAEAHGLEKLTFTGVLAKSSNIGTIEVAQQLGKQKLYDALRSFGFGAPTGVGLPGESGGILPPPDSWSGTQLPTIAFGQGVAVTALQVASVYATVADGGVRVPPRLVRGTVGADGELIPAPPPTPRRVLSVAVSTELRNMLEAATTDQGTAPLARIPGYRVAGKTGTAQIAAPGGGYLPGQYTASFVGFAPTDAPQLVVAVVLQAPAHGQFGGTVAAPVFSDVMAYALQSRRVAPTWTPPAVAQLVAP